MLPPMRVLVLVSAIVLGLTSGRWGTSAFKEGEFKVITAGNHQKKQRTCVADGRMNESRSIIQPITLF